MHKGYNEKQLRQYLLNQNYAALARDWRRLTDQSRTDFDGRERALQYFQEMVAIVSQLEGLPVVQATERVFWIIQTGWSRRLTMVQRRCPRTIQRGIEKPEGSL